MMVQAVEMAQSRCSGGFDARMAHTYVEQLRYTQIPLSRNMKARVDTRVGYVGVEPAVSKKGYPLQI